MGSWIQKSQCVELSPGNWERRTDSSIAGASCRNVPPANDERSGTTMGVGGDDEEEEESLLMSAKTRVKKSRVASHAMSEVLIGAHHSLPPSQHESRAAAIKTIFERMEACSSS